jgi:hypothetical protein
LADCQDISFLAPIISVIFATIRHCFHQMSNASQEHP